MLPEICAIALTGAAAALVLSSINGTLTFAVRIGTIIVTLAIVLTLGASVFSELRDVIVENEEVGKYANIIIRALGVALLGHFTSLVCRELGSESLSFVAELAAKLEIFVLCLPLIKEIMSCARAILEM